MGIMHTFSVGAIHHPGAQKAIRALKKGEEVLLVREPKNTFDRNAVAVHNGDFLKLGYVPRQDAPAVAKAMAAGEVQAHCAAAGFTTIVITWGEDLDTGTKTRL
jgi:hypothetical protein